MPRRAAKVDNSHQPIIKRLKQLGIPYTDVSGLPNFCDILVYFRGVTYHIEAKTLEYASKAAQKNLTLLLTPGEKKHMEKCIDARIPYLIVFDADEMLRGIGATK